VDLSMERAYKFRIYPNNKQEILLNKSFGCTRLVYNHFLHKRIEHYEKTGKTLNYNSCSKLLTSFKSEKPFLKEIDKFALQNTLRDLDIAFKNFFNGSGYPKYKSKRDNTKSYRTNFTNNNIEVFEKYIKLPKVGKIRRRGYNHIIEDKVISATISKTPTGKYYCSLLINVDVKSLPKTNSNIGIDLGIKVFATCSNGEVIENPRTLSKFEKKLKIQQHILSRKQKGSKNFHKQRLKVAKLHEKIANIRLDFINKVTSKLINENQVIVLEDLDIKEMVLNNKLAKAIMDLGINKFETKLKYKATWYDRDLIYIDRFFPSSQLCSACGQINPLVKNLAIRKWICPSCGVTHNRDENASLNILNEGLRLHKQSVA